MNNNPLVSVVMSVYNSEKYLDEAIQSILTQTYTNFEFIIINDGSLDDSLKIIQRYMKNDKRIILINRENKGLPYSLNEGIKLSRGKYIVRMDSDDISFENRFEEQVKYMEGNSQIGISGTYVEVFGKNTKNTILKHPLFHDEMKTRLLFSVCFAHPTVIIRRKILDKYNLKYNEEYINSQDYELWSNISEFTKMANIPKILLKYRVSENSITAKTDAEKVELRYRLLNGVFEKYIKQLNIKTTEKENRLHFNIGLNERIAKNNIDLKILNSYLNKLIKANIETKIFSQIYLEKYLAKKFLIVVYYKIKKKDFSFMSAVFYKIFWNGLYNILKAKMK